MIEDSKIERSIGEKRILKSIRNKKKSDQISYMMILFFFLAIKSGIYHQDFCCCCCSIVHWMNEWMNQPKHTNTQRHNRFPYISNRNFSPTMTITMMMLKRNLSWVSILVEKKINRNIILTSLVMYLYVYSLKFMLFLFSFCLWFNFFAIHLRKKRSPISPHHHNDLIANLDSKNFSISHTHLGALLCQLFFLFYICHLYIHPIFLF